METMRTLDTSLPASSPKPRPAQPPEQLLQAFKAAALSVTNLYKTAASDQAAARRNGYQDALDDLLSYLDKENLGLETGEGWKVRQWATERLDGSTRQEPSSESDDERLEAEDRARSSSPVVHRKPTGELSSNVQPTRSVSPQRTESAPPSTGPAPFLRTSDHFTFRSTVPYPQPSESDMDMNPDTTATASQIESRTQTQPPATTTSSTPSVRLQVTPRHSKSGKHGSSTGRVNNRPSISLGSLGSGAGLKRKIPFSEFFDISSIGDGKDRYGNGGGGGGGKRGRFV